MMSFVHVENSSCTYQLLPYAVFEEFSGNTIGTKELKWKEKVSDCEEYCNNLSNCHSFIYQRTKRECFFKDKLLTGDEPMCPGDTITYNQNCTQGI